MTIGTLCSGVGGVDLGFERAGFEVLWMCEIDKNCQNILRRHFPGKPIYPDMTKLDTSSMQRPDVLHGSTPCQGFSVAGLRGSLQDNRSNLCLQFVRIANELNPGIIVWENVVGCLSTRDNAFGCFIAALVGADAPLVPPRTIDRWRPFTERPDCTEACLDDSGRYRCQHTVITGEAFSWPNAGVVVGSKRTAAWRVIDSQWHGVAQRRERVFVVADSLGGCAPQILFERKGMCWNPPTRPQAGQGVAGTLSASPPSRRNGGSNPTEGHLIPDVAWALQERDSKGSDSKGSDSSTKDGHLIPVQMQEPIPIQEIGKRQSGNSMNGVGRGKPGDPMYTLQSGAQHGVCCFQSKDSGESSENIAPTLRALNFKDSHLNGGGQLAVAFDTTQIISPGNYSHPKEGDPCHPLAAGAHPPAVAFKPSHYTRDKDVAPSDVVPPLSADADKGDQEPVIAFQPRYFNRENKTGGAPSDMVDITNCKKAGDSAPVVAYRTSGNCGAMEQGDKTAALNTATDPNQNIVAFQTRIARNGRGQTESVVPALSGADAGATSDMRPCVASRTMVRRLTPIECARLQAHPDDWCAWGIDANGKRIEQSDSSQYKQYGNGVTVNVLEFIARRVAKFIKP